MSLKNTPGALFGGNQSDPAPHLADEETLHYIGDLEQEVAKLREQLAEAKNMSVANICLRVSPGFDGNGKEEFATSTHDVVAMLVELSERAEAAEAKLKAASEQEPVWDGNCSGGDRECEAPSICGRDGRCARNDEPIYATPIPPADVQELQAKIAYLESYIEGQNDSFAQMMEGRRELERKLAVAQISLRAADVMAKVCDEWVVSHQIDSRSALADARLDYGHPYRYEARLEELNALLAQAREEGRKEGFADGSANAGFAHALDCNIAYEDGRARGRKEAVPEGWQAVPKLTEMTNGFLRAAHSEYVETVKSAKDTVSEVDVYMIYQALLNNAPKPEVKA